MISFFALFVHSLFVEDVLAVTMQLRQFRITCFAQIVIETLGTFEDRSVNQLRTSVAMGNHVVSFLGGYFCFVLIADFLAVLAGRATSSKSPRKEDDTFFWDCDAWPFIIIRGYQCCCWWWWWWWWWWWFLFVADCLLSWSFLFGNILYLLLSF